MKNDIKIPIGDNNAINENVDTEVVKSWARTL